VAFSKEKKFFKYIQVSKVFKAIHGMTPGPRLKNRLIDRL
jgi:hypothetical protein